jgi:hypothetical protein
MVAPARTKRARTRDTPMKREKRLTKRERKELAPPRPATAAAPRANNQEQHIHCVACGRHLDPVHFEPPATATVVRCQHGSSFAACSACVPRATEMLAEHDRTGKPVAAAAPWH